CAAVTTYENNLSFGHFHTTIGIAASNLVGNCTYPNADFAFSQFDGALTNITAISALGSWGLLRGSFYTNGFYPSIVIAGQSTNTPYAAVAKLRSGKPGANMFYLGGHDYQGATIMHYNGRRMMLNAIFVPVDRPGDCGVNFETDLAVNQTDGVTSVTNGQVVA